MLARHFCQILFALSFLLISACSSETKDQTEVITQTENDNSPIPIVLSGYGPPTSSFSQGLTHIGEKIQAQFGNQVDVSYIYNILEHGYTAAGAQIELVENGELTLGYVTMSEGIPALEVAALPFLFSDAQSIRAAMDGELGKAAIESIEANSGLRILGFYENGFRHISNSVRPVRTPEDLDKLKIRVLAIEKPALELMGASPLVTSLPTLFDGLATGELDGQENPFENVVTYNLHLHQSYYTETAHSYLSRPIFVNRQHFDAWPEDLQQAFRIAVNEAIQLQRGLHDDAELAAAQTIRESGGEIIQLTEQERQAFVDAVSPIYDEARQKYDSELLELVGL